MAELTNDFSGFQNSGEKQSLVLPFERGAYAKPMHIDVQLADGRAVNFFLGLPIDTPTFEPNKSKLIVPTKPYIYKTPNLTVLRGGSPHDVRLKDTIIMEAHARRHRDDDQWYFADGQKVRDVVEGYQKYAQQMKLPTVEFLAACNREVNEEAMSMGILVKDIPEDLEVAQVVGDVMGFPFRHAQTIPDSGFIDLWVTAGKNGSFWGVDELIEKKKQAGLLE